MRRLCLPQTGRLQVGRLLRVPVQAVRSYVAPRRSQPAESAGTARPVDSSSRQPSARPISNTAPGPARTSPNSRWQDSGRQPAGSSARRTPSPQQKTANRSVTTQQRVVDYQETKTPVRARDILLKRRAPAKQQPSAVPQQEHESDIADPTFVPRNPAVTDGPWSEVDAQLVAAAQQDAKLPQAPPDLAAAGASATSAQQQQQQPDLAGQVLLGQAQQQLAQLAQQLGQPAYRGQQLLDGIMKGAHKLSDIKGIPKSFAQQLEALGMKTGRSVTHQKVVARDGTVKLLLQLQEGRVIETVGIPVNEEGKQRLTVCVSSQVGCPMRCTFCATGKGGFARNLLPHEIIDQVLTVSEVFGGQRVSNVVFMGMGEPLLNLPGVTAAVGVLQQQLGISGRSITISTVGVPNAIAKLAQHKLTCTLAVSIHAPNQELREKLVPSAKVYPITALMRDCATYFRTTKRRVTFEYTLMAGTNDKPEQAEELIDLLRQYKLMSHVNLIPWNPVDDSDYRRPSKSSVSAFQQVLETAGLPVSVRSTRGLEAAAACGQLRNKFQKKGVDSPVLLS